MSKDIRPTVLTAYYHEQDAVAGSCRHCRLIEVAKVSNKQNFENILWSILESLLELNNLVIHGSTCSTCTTFSVYILLNQANGRTRVFIISFLFGPSTKRWNCDECSFHAYQPNDSNNTHKMICFKINVVSSVSSDLVLLIIIDPFPLISMFF